jgi:hypothetical protein
VNFGLCLGLEDEGWRKLAGERGEGEGLRILDGLMERGKDITTSFNALHQITAWKKRHVSKHPLPPCQNFNVQLPIPSHAGLLRQMRYRKAQRNET